MSNPDPTAGNPTQAPAGDPNAAPNPGADPNNPVTQAPDGDNSGGNNPIDPSFWDDPDAGTEPPKEPDSPDVNPMQAMDDAVNKIDFGEAITPDVQAELAEGKYDGLNTAMQEMHKKSFNMMLQVMMQMKNGLETTINERVDAGVNTNNTQQVETQLLKEHIPQYANPGIAPVVDGVFQQALKKNGGDNQKAIATTKAFLDAMSPDGGQGGNLNPQWGGAPTEDWPDFFAN